MDVFDLNRLLQSLAPDHVEYLAEMAVRLARIETEKWTGRINFEMHASQGTIGTFHIETKETISRGTAKRRMIRSRGI